jgi:hypothetical protein
MMPAVSIVMKEFGEVRCDIGCIPLRETRDARSILAAELVALGADASKRGKVCPTLARKVGRPPTRVKFCLLLSQPNTIPLEDGVVGVEVALRYTKREASFIDHNVLHSVVLLLSDYYGGTASFGVVPSVATQRNFGSGHRGRSGSALDAKMAHE